MNVERGDRGAAAVAGVAGVAGAEVLMKRYVIDVSNTPINVLIDD